MVWLMMVQAVSMKREMMIGCRKGVVAVPLPVASDWLVFGAAQCPRKVNFEAVDVACQNSAPHQHWSSRYQYPLVFKHRRAHGLAEDVLEASRVSKNRSSSGIKVTAYGEYQQRSREK